MTPARKPPSVIYMALWFDDVFVTHTTRRRARQRTFMGERADTIYTYQLVEAKKKPAKAKKAGPAARGKAK